MGVRNIKGVDAIVAAFCADFERRESEIEKGELEYRVEMEYRYYNSKIYTAAVRVVGMADAMIYINEIGARIGYARSAVTVSETTYKKRKRAVIDDIAASLYLI